MMVRIIKWSSYIPDSRNKLYHPKRTIVLSELGKIKQCTGTGNKNLNCQTPSG